MHTSCITADLHFSCGHVDDLVCKAVKTIHLGCKLENENRLKAGVMGQYSTYDGWYPMA